MRFVRVSLWCGLALLCIILLTVVQAHVPITTGDNEAIETATHIHDPLKSWAVYAELREGGVVNYFEFEMEQGQRLRLSLFTPRESAFTPGLVVMGSGIEPQGTVPEFVTVPAGLDARVIEGQRPDQGSYEPFTPSALYEVADLDTTVTTAGTYYVAVYEPTNGGRYGLAVGYREEFTLVEWIRVPLDVIGVRRWEGQAWTVILAPLFAIVIPGFALLFWQRRTMRTHDWLGCLAAFLYIGSGGITLTQMGIAVSLAPVTGAVIITLILALLPITVGMLLLRLALRVHASVAAKERVGIAILGIIGLFIWAGLVIGPILALLTSILPERSTVNL
ncbi:MAG TPA: hypothetical protein ENN68_05275 [Methanomicrobia archaeon]|nr:hypothetical protein [Methanomicrobia archaeon]